MMIPITRKEKYINEIAGGGNTAPETPYTREELFFADILGEVVAPSPITRAEKYLAKIANRYSGELPEPVTRIERFLARAAGMDVTIPTPITREEMFWADYALIVEKELSGIPPLTFVSNGENLVDYRIYGSSGGVGDRTKNLFNINTATPVYISSNGSEGVADQRNLTSDFISVIPGESYIWKAYPTTNGQPWSAVAFYTNGQFVSRTTAQAYTLTFTVPENVNSIRVGSRYMQNGGRGQLELGTDVTSYEPYGYKIPVVCGGITTNIYLDEPLAKPGNNADYIDYAAQKRHNSDGTESSVTLPEISTLAGTNTLTVGTEVQPSNVYIKYEGV